MRVRSRLARARSRDCPRAGDCKSKIGRDREPTHEPPAESTTPASPERVTPVGLAARKTHAGDVRHAFREDKSRHCRCLAGFELRTEHLPACSDALVTHVQQHQHISAVLVESDAQLRCETAAGADPDPVSCSRQGEALVFELQHERESRTRQDVQCNG